MPWKRKDAHGHAQWFMIWLAALLLTACGGGGHSAKTTAADAGEPCLAPGAAQTGCVCSATQPAGVRQCQANMIWTRCSCPPSQAADKCKQGDPVMCTCPGQANKITTCLQDGTYDCNC